MCVSCLHGGGHGVRIWKYCCYDHAASESMRSNCFFLCFMCVMLHLRGGDLFDADAAAVDVMVKLFFL